MKHMILETFVLECARWEQERALYSRVAIDKPYTIIVDGNNVEQYHGPSDAALRWRALL